MSYNCSVGLACNLCGECVDVCPAGSLIINDGQLLYDGADCQYCETCSDICPECAIRIYMEE